MLRGRTEPFPEHFPLRFLNRPCVEGRAIVVVEPPFLQLGNREPIGSVILLRLIPAAVKLPIDLIPQPLAPDPEQRERPHPDDLAGQIGLDLAVTTELPDGVAEWIQPPILRPRVVERHAASIR